MDKIAVSESTFWKGDISELGLNTLNFNDEFIEDTFAE